MKVLGRLNQGVKVQKLSSAAAVVQSDAARICAAQDFL